MIHDRDQLIKPPKKIDPREQVDQAASNLLGNLDRLAEHGEASDSPTRRRLHKLYRKLWEHFGESFQ